MRDSAVAARVDRIIEESGVKIRFAIPRVVEVGRVGTINSMVREDVSQAING
jgi:hypothetical protein